MGLAILLQTSLPLLGSRQHAPQTALADGSALDPMPIAPPPVRKAAGGAINTNLVFSPVLPETEAGSILQGWLDANPHLLNLSVTPSLRLDYLHTVHGVGGLRDRVYVHFVQTVQGVDVAGTDVSFSFDPSVSPLRIDSLRSSLYPGITIASLPTQADTAARLKITRRAGSINAQTLPRRIRWIDGRWQALQEYLLPEQGLHAAINAEGEIRVWDDRQYSIVSGQVTGRGVMFDPVATGANLNTIPLPDLKIADGAGADVYTDSQGNYTFSTPSPMNVMIGLSGRWGLIQDLGNSPLSVTLSPGAASPANLTFNPSGSSENSDAQVNGYLHEHVVHDYIKTRGVDPDGLDTILPVYVNENDVCNSYYILRSIHFFKSGGGCINSAYDTFIYHEYGHFIDDLIGGITNQALSEGWGDIMAMFVSGQPKMGEAFFGTPASEVRDGVNSYIYHAGDESHTEGQAWMGFAWDLRAGLIETFGQTQGIALAENLILPVFWANSADIPSAVREVALRDSPDGDPTHAVHFALIAGAATNHGIGSLLPSSVTITSPANNATVSGVITISGTASDSAGVASVSIGTGSSNFGVATGTTSWTFVLDTTLLTNGPLSLTATSKNYSGTGTTATIQLQVSNAGQAGYDSALKAPACTDASSICDSRNLVNGRGPQVGGVEPNQPNTINNSCADGKSGTYHVDESIDHLRVSTSDGQAFAAGKTARIDATVWAYSDQDYLDLYYAANANTPSWIFIGTSKAGAHGLQLMSGTYTLPVGTRQAIRASLRFFGVAAPCTYGYYDDHDDLVFAVTPGVPALPNPPTGVILSNPTVSSLQLNWNAAAGPIAGYRVDVSRDSAFTNFITGYQNLDAGSALSQLVNNLQPATSYFARVRSYDASGNISTNSATASGTTAQVAAPVITSPLSAAAQVGAAFEYTITATNSPTSFNAMGLPAGLSVMPGTGQIFGTPSFSGNFTINISATNAGGTGVATLLLTVSPAAMAPPVITSPTSTAGTVGVPFTYTIAGTNTPTSFQATGLPGGLSLNPVTGVISGVPLSAGVTTVVLGATNAAGTGTGTLRVTIVAPAPPGAPVAGFTAAPMTGSAPLTVVFDASGSTGGNLTYSWNFGDHVVDWGATASHTYTQSGAYAVTLTVANGFGTDHIRLVVAVTGN